MLLFCRGITEEWECIRVFAVPNSPTYRGSTVLDFTLSNEQLYPHWLFPAVKEQNVVYFQHESRSIDYTPPKYIISHSEDNYDTKIDISRWQATDINFV